jgi:peptide/nickel transport system substrate-binding protein
MNDLTRRQLIRAGAVGGAAMGLPGMLGACDFGSDSGSGSGANGEIDNLTWVYNSLETLDVAKADYGLKVHVLATEPIVVHDEKLNVVGHLAESWEAVDPRTYVYKVRQGVKFWDGSPLTADDIAYAMSRHVDPKVGSLLAGIIPPIDSIDVTDDFEVTVKLKEPNATWARVPTYMLVGAKKYYERYGKDFGGPDGKIMGTGPYVVKRFKSAESVEYARNENYWGPKPAPKKIKMAMINEPQTMVLAARAGEIDGTFELTDATLSDWRALDNFEVSGAPGTSISFASFDTSIEPWNDVHVRRAFAYAFDREGLLNAILKGNGELVNSIVPRSQWPGSTPKGWLDDLYASLRTYDFDLAKARAEIEQSGHPDGLTASIWYYNTSPKPERIALVWKQNLAKIGVTLKLEPVTPEEGDARQTDHRDLGLNVNAEWTPYYPDPIDRPLTLLPGKAAKRGYYNLANYRNPVVDKLIDENLASIDEQRRAELLARVMKIASEDLPYIPLWTTTSAVAVRDSFEYQGFSPWYETQSWIEHIKAT